MSFDKPVKRALAKAAAKLDEGALAKALHREGQRIMDEARACFPGVVGPVVEERGPVKQRPRWCPRCKDLRPWQKVRLLGARASYRACARCGARTRPRMPGTKKRVPRPGSWKQLMKACDDLARPRAHARGSCEECGRTKRQARLEWAHGMGRAYHAVRHLDDNGRLLCYRCHTYFTNHWPEWMEWLVRKMGQERFAYVWEHRNDRCGVEQLGATLAVLRSGEPCVEVSP